MIESYETREEWLAARKKGVGASEVAAILGLSKWRGALEVYADKTSEILEPPASERVEELRGWGLALEEPIAREYEARTGRRVFRNEALKVHTHPTTSLFATLDAVISPTSSEDPRWKATVEGDSGVLEIKTVDRFLADDWKDSAPLEHQIQVQAQLAVTGYTWGVVCGLIGGNRLVPYEIERDEEFISIMLNAVSDFWARVQRREPPPADGTESSKRGLHRLYPRHSEGKRIQLPGMAEVWLRVRETAKEKLANAQAELDAVENEIKAAMGDAQVGEIPGGGEFTWKARKQKGYTVEPMEKRVLRHRKAQ